MKICSRELTQEEYVKAREGLGYVRNLIQHGLSNYTTMREQGHPVTDEMIQAQRLQLDALNTLFPGEDTHDEANEPPPAPVA